MTHDHTATGSAFRESGAFGIDAKTTGLVHDRFGGADTFRRGLAQPTPAQWG